MAVIIPGILTSDEKEYKQWLLVAERASGLVQIDVVDGKFANNKTIGTDVILKYPSSCKLEVQLMVTSPIDYVKRLKSAEYIWRIIFPFEIAGDRTEVIDLIKKSGRRAGLSINPETPLYAISSLMEKIDLLCIFSASPGFSGKKLSEMTYERIKEARASKPKLPLEVDIGVNFETAPKLAQAGADFLVATSVLKNSDNYYKTYKKLVKLVEN